jgi:hypothetical protein
MNVEKSPSPVTETRACERRDLASGLGFWLIWILPIVVLWLTVSVRTPSLDLVVTPYLVVIWPVLLAFMGGACLYNARGCGRLHCYITGPFFLLLALVALSYGMGWLPLGPHGWTWLANVLILGSITLTYLPERLFGKYQHRTVPKT